LESKSETVFHFYKGLQDFSSKLSLLVFFYRLLEVYQQDISQFDLMEDFVVDDLLINFSFPEKHNLNKLYLLKARYFILKGNKVQARAAMNQINLLYIYSCDKGWVNQQVAIIEAAC
jgi:hypothetical protein